MSTTMLRTGIIGVSSKENEWRLPIHPEHFCLIPETVRQHLYVERGYAQRYGVSDEDLRPFVAGVESRDQLLGGCDLVIIPKPTEADLAAMREGGVLCGWAHCVQQMMLTQLAIDRRLTVIAWESMNSWHASGEWDMHVFYRNNEIAGYTAVVHALGQIGRTGWYGVGLKHAAIIGSGSVARGAAQALRTCGCDTISQYGLAPIHLVGNRILGVEYHEMVPVENGRLAVRDRANGSLTDLSDRLAEADLVVNGLLQDPDRPLTYMTESDARRMKPGSLIVDVSCDEGMGFTFARPTTFQLPVVHIGRVAYYAVDHTPSFLWDSATEEISEAILPYLPTIMAGPESWDADETIRRAIEIRSGTVINQQIISFQHRSKAYPHLVTDDVRYPTPSTGSMS
jgi:alanine dehydrogenase